jgi:threonine/homoserine/homoserine lactone efflux protein
VDGVVSVLLLDAHLLAFAGVAAIVIATPGQDTALTIRNSLIGGRRSGVFTAAGVAAGQCVWALATSAGLAALLVASEPAFLALRFAGAAYLIYLGLQALLAAVRSVEPRAVRPRLGSSVFRQGLLSNLGNPKMAMFFASLLPQFAPAGSGSFVALLALSFLFCSMTFVWLTLYAVAVTRARALLGGRARRALDAVTGVVLVALGARLATEKQ